MMNTVHLGEFWRLCSSHPLVGDELKPEENRGLKNDAGSMAGTTIPTGKDKNPTMHHSSFASRDMRQTVFTRLPGWKF